jgi:hypothetical protein
MKKLYLIIILVCGILGLSIFLLIKVYTTIYIGDYTGATRYSIDIKLKIDDKYILNDSMTKSSPGCPEFEIEEKLNYGLHKISIYSNKANVYQEEKIFLLPNQHIAIEFFPADTLTLFHYCFPDSVFINGTRLSDSVFEQYKLPKELDFPIMTEKSRFDIRTEFNPFYTE